MLGERRKNALRKCECTKITATAIISIKGNNYSSRNTNNRFNTDRSNIRGLRVGFHGRPSWSREKTNGISDQFRVPRYLRSADDLCTISLWVLGLVICRRMEFMIVSTDFGICGSLAAINAARFVVAEKRADREGIDVLSWWFALSRVRQGVK